jgi:large subunit ribosomal protein L24
MPKAMRIKTDDQVVIISGKDRGKSGRVLRTEPKKRRVYVEGLNIVKRHERPRSTGDMATANPGGIVEKEGPINVSNVMLLDPKGNKGTRLGVRRGEDGKRVRIAKRSGAEVD